MEDTTTLMAEALCELLDDDDDDDVLLLTLAFLGPPHRRPAFPAFNFDAQEDNEAFLDNYRFDKKAVVALATELGLPEQIICQQRTKATKLEAFCIFLRRLAYPNRLADLVPQFGRSESEMSYIIKEVTDIIYDRHCGKLSNLAWLDEHQCPRFATAIREKGAPVSKCWGFIDGTTLQISRPKYHQRHVFSGHKRHHCLKFQAVMTPDGIISHLFGPLEGKRHDLGLLARSGLYTEMENIFQGHPEPYYLYGDPGYTPRPLLLTPFKGATLTADQMRFNKSMSSLRICVEWGFGKVKQNFAFLDF